MLKIMEKIDCDHFLSVAFSTLCRKSDTTSREPIPQKVEEQKERLSSGQTACGFDVRFPSPLDGIGLAGEPRAGRSPFALTEIEKVYRVHCEVVAREPTNLRS